MQQGMYVYVCSLGQIGGLKLSTVREICDSLCENRTCRGINKNEIYPKIGGKCKFMDLLIINSPVSLDIVLSIR